MPTVINIPLAECPPQELVIRFHTGALATDDFERVADHVSSCEKCMASLIRLHASPPSDPLLKALQRYQAGATMHEAGERLAKTARRLRPGTPGVRKIDRGLLTIREKQFGPYELEKVLGHGGMGVVYLARQKRLNRLVAIKTILAGQHAGQSVRERFKIEGEAVARLKHPRVIQIFEFDEHDGVPYFSMELAEGGSLKDLIKKGPLAPRRAAEMLAEIADGVDYAHAQKVLHRDLKPGNILIDANGEPKITDFGLAKLLDIETGGTRTEVILGTPSYMAPEQASENHKQVDRRTDVYSLGAILYEMLTGEAPFKGDTRSEILQQVRKAEPAPPTSKVSYIPHELELICLKCLEKSPDRRYASAALLAEDLRAHLAGKPTVAAAHEWRSKVRKGVKKHAMKVAAGLTILFALGAAWYYDPERAVRQLESQLSATHSVSLLQIRGMPKWFNWRHGEKLSTLSVHSDGTLALKTLDYAMVDLFPQPKSSNYRFSAEIRQISSLRLGRVGLFLCAHEQDFKNGRGQRFVNLDYNDMDPEGAQLTALLLQNAPANKLLGQEKSILNTAHLGYRAIVPTADGEIGEREIFRNVRQVVEAQGVSGGLWRSLVIEVRGTQIKGFWDGNELGELQWSEVRQQAALEAFHVKPTIQLEGDNGWNGALGLLVHGAGAYFRSVKLELISDP